MEKLTKKKAKELCIKKWQYIVDNNGSSEDLIKECPELRELDCWCGYCELYHMVDGNCLGCPIYINGCGGCTSNTHPWSLWVDNKNTQTAQAVLDLILKS